MIIKYKYANEAKTGFCTVNEDGTKNQSWNQKNKPGYYAEMIKWVEAGNEIEPQFTEAELAEREAKEKEDAISNQRALCKQYLDISEKHMTNDPPYPGDVAKWITARTEWKRIYKSGVIETVPELPFK